MKNVSPFAREKICPPPPSLTMIKTQEELGKPYGFWRAILYLFCILLKIDVDKRDGLKKVKSIYCSEYVARV